MKTHSDDVIKSPRVLDGAAEIQAVEGLSQCTISVALGEFNYQGIRLRSSAGAWSFLSMFTLATMI